jgi:hypothetical protein
MYALTVINLVSPYKYAKYQTGWMAGNLGSDDEDADWPWCAFHSVSL